MNEQAERYRHHAEELRVIAENAMLEDTRRTLLNLADSYEQMAGMVDAVMASPTPAVGRCLASAVPSRG